jgi:hypothetical protein
MSEPDYAEFDELHRTWLARPHLQLFAVISLARGTTPARWAEAHKRYWCDCLALKSAITTGLLKAYRDDPSKLRYDNTVIYLFDLAKFLDEAGQEYDWLRDFAKRWKSYAGTLGQGKPIGRKRNDPQKERDTRGLLDDVLNMGRELQKKDPKLTRAEIIAKISEASQFRRYSRETIRQIIYGTYRPMKNRNLIGLPD